MRRRAFLATTSLLLLPEDLLARGLHEHPTVIAMAEACNAYRARMGRPPVAIHPQLTYAAVMHSRKMAQTGRMSHNLLGTSPGSRARAAGYRGGVAENIAMGTNSISGTMRMWINSGGHRRNMLSSHRYGGFGLAYRGGAGYWTQLFG